jgi:hypothetical protein
MAITRMQLDAEMEKLCAKDGGTRVYQHITLSPEKYEEQKEKNFYDQSSIEKVFGTDFLMKQEESYLHGSPEIDPWDKPCLIRYHEQLFRKVDGKLLGEVIWYMRIGGKSGLSRIERYISGHPGVESCPRGLDINSVTMRVFSR